MTRRTAIAILAASLGRAAARLPANRNIRWALGANLWNYFPRVPFTDILDVMRDTGFIGIRLTQFPGILKTYGITAAQLQTEVEKRGLSVVTVSFNGPTRDESQRKNVLAAAHDAMEFLRDFGAAHLVVFSPRRLPPGSDVERQFRVMCHSFNAIGELAAEMGM